MTTIRVQGKPLYQWDTDRRVIIEPGNGVTIDDVHFSTDGENSLGVEHAADENGIVSAPIPNILLQSGSNITVYACMATANGQHTIASRIVSVINRAKPADYVYTETEVKSYAALKKKLSEKLPANQGAENAGKVLVIDDDGYAVPGEVQGSGNDGAGIDITGATAGQVAQIADVDENGEPTKWQPADLPAVAAMTGATAETAGASGLVPAPAAGDGGKFLRGDGTWRAVDVPDGGIDQDELQAAVNAALEQAKSGLLVFKDSYVDNTANWLTNGYTKVSQTATIGQPSQCTGADKWGVLFFIAENAAMGTGTHMYFPIDGTYKGRVFTRSVTQRTPGEWYLLPTMNDIPTGGGGGGTTDHTLGISGAAVGQIAKITAVDGDGVPTAWKSVDLPSGGWGEYRVVADITLTETVTNDITIEEDADGNPFELDDVYVYVSSILAEESTAEYSGSDVGIKACDMAGYQNQYYAVCFVGSSLKPSAVPFVVRIKHLTDRYKEISIFPNSNSEGVAQKTTTIYFAETYKNWTAIPNGKIRGIRLAAFSPTKAFYGAGTRVLIIGR